MRSQRRLVRLGKRGTFLDCPPHIADSVGRMAPPREADPSRLGTNSCSRPTRRRSPVEPPNGVRTFARTSAVCRADAAEQSSTILRLRRHSSPKCRRTGKIAHRPDETADARLGDVQQVPILGAMWHDFKLLLWPTTPATPRGYRPPHLSRSSEDYGEPGAGFQLPEASRYRSWVASRAPARWMSLTGKSGVTRLR